MSLEQLQPAYTDPSSRYNPQAQENPGDTQRRASDPSTHVWVSASAGTGKTKVLTDRVLRLLLPRADGQPATPPQTILGITFTKAAANEMQIRILETLASWSVMEEETLENALADLFGHAPRADQIEQARSLFTRMIDLPRGLSIMTIDSFCESILARFPIEAGLEGGFEILDERERPKLLQACLDDWLTDHAESDLPGLLMPLLDRMNPLGFLTGLADKAAMIRDENSNPEAITAQLGEHSAEQLWNAYLETLDTRKDLLRKAVTAIEDYGSDALKNRYAPLRDWLEGVSPLAPDNLFSLFLTTKGEIRDKLLVQKVETNAPQVAEIIRFEADAAYALRGDLADAALAADSAQFITFARDILARYQDKKSRINSLDFTDLVFYTSRLLRHSRDRLDWVMYRLDGGIRHILLDEAQDTNADQWDIIDALSAGFFDGEGVFAPGERSLFVVGDDKQSIYGFRGADSTLFARMRDHFKQQAEHSGQTFTEIDMTISFRSGEAVLTLVNSLLDDEDLRRAMTDTPRNRLTHTAWRGGQAGSVEIWPLLSNTDAPDIDLWADHPDINLHATSPKRLADHITRRIKNWLDQGIILESRGRPIRPGDILILFHKRTGDIYAELGAALRDAGIPVAGTDRITLSKEMAVIDLSAAISFALLPQDDLSLAALLKSPFIGLDEERLCTLSAGRQGSLWQAVRQSALITEEVQNWLSNLIRLGAELGPFSLLMHILHTPCPAHALCGQSALIARLGRPVLDGVGEFITQAANAQFNKRLSLEAFAQTMTGDDNSIKRETEDSSDSIRMMTVHGAKGLQAPIVILPDTVTSDRALRPDSGDPCWPQAQPPLPFPVWSSRPANAGMGKAVTDHLLHANIAEYQRQLYVAATRAEDHLLICGAYGTQTPHAASWHHSLTRAFATLPHGNTPFDEEAAEASLCQSVLTHHCEQNAQAHDKQKSAPDQAKPDTIPPWLLTPAEKERTDQRPLSPSRMDDVDTHIPVPSPLYQHADDRFLRGNLTHALLQFLPSLPPQSREERAKTYLEMEGRDLSPALRESILGETLAVLNNPDYGDLFGPDSRAEIPLAGMVDGRPVSGQIDRLVIRESDILIIDYKTNRPAPTRAEDIPAAYVTQMHMYRSLIGQIYPDKTVRGLLLWTENGQMMELP